VQVGLVGARDPARAGHDPRVGQVADAGGRVGAQHLRPDVALDQGRVGGEVLRLEGGRLGRRHGRLESLDVDLPVPRQTDHQGLPLAVGVLQQEDHVLERVGPRPRPVGAGHLGVEPGHQQLDRRVAGGRQRTRRGGVRRIERRGRRRGDGLDVGRVAAGAAHEGVLAVLREDQELLGRRAAHGARRRPHDDVLETQPVEDPDVGGPVQVVGRLQARLVHVERVGVLHDELAAPQDARARPGLVAVLRLDLVQHHG